MEATLLVAILAITGRPAVMLYFPKLTQREISSGLKYMAEQRAYIWPILFDLLGMADIFLPVM